jgi:hypothetical protein
MSYNENPVSVATGQDIPCVLLSLLDPLMVCWHVVRDPAPCVPYWLTNSWRQAGWQAGIKSWQ